MCLRTRTARETSGRWSIYNNKYDSTKGTIHISVGFMDKGSGSMRQRSLTEGLGLSTSESVILMFRDNHGLEYLKRATDIHWHGMAFDLRGFQSVVLLDWRELRPSAEWPWDKLCDALAGRGVPNVHDELALMRMKPLHDALREAVSHGNVFTLAEIADEFAGYRHARILPGDVAETEPATGESAVEPKQLKLNKLQLDRLRAIAEKSRYFYNAIVESLPEESRVAKPDAKTLKVIPGAVVSTPDDTETVRLKLAAATRLPSLAKAYASDWMAKSRPVIPGTDATTRHERTWAPILAWTMVRSLPTQGDRVEFFDRMLMRRALADIFGSMGMEGEARWQAAAQVRLLLSKTALAPIAIQSERFWEDPDVRWLAGVNESDGVSYFNKEQFEELLTWLQLPALLEIGQGAGEEADQIERIAAVEKAVAAASDAAEVSGYNLEKYFAAFRKPIEKITASKPAPAGKV